MGKRRNPSVVSRSRLSFTATYFNADWDEIASLCKSKVTVEAVESLLREWEQAHGRLEGMYSSTSSEIEAAQFLTLEVHYGS
jgi:hypothetical protein